MTKETALKLITEYDQLAREQLRDTPLIGISSRFPDNGDVLKAMRWLGYCQGVLNALGVFSLDDLKEHTRRGSMSEEAR